MTFDERVQKVAKRGFTERQARFLTTVMLHTGVCVPRQYARFAACRALDPPGALPCSWQLPERPRDLTPLEWTCDGPMLDTEVHIVAGPSAAACLQDGLALLPPDQVLVHHDLLSCGPLLSLISLDDWRDVRESYLRSLDIDGPSLSFGEQDRDLLTNRERLRSAETITLWLGTGLAEQLMLVWVITLLRELGADAGRCRIVQFNLDRKHEVVAVGVLDPLRFKEHPPPTGLTESAIQKPRRRGKRSQRLNRTICWRFWPPDRAPCGSCSERCRRFCITTRIWRPA